MNDRLKHWAREFAPASLLRFLKQRHFARELIRIRENEEPDLALVRQLVHEGDIALDVGANVGLYTKMLSECVGRRGRVLSIEPVPDTFAILRYCVRRLRLDNVDLLDCAVSDSMGHVRMEVPRAGVGGFNFYRSRIVENPTSDHEVIARSVPIRTLDEIVLPRFRRVAFIKMDVEGHETRAMRGAMELLRRDHPALLVELSSDPDDPTTDAASLVQVLRDLTYQPHWWDGRTLHQRQPGAQSVNYAFLTAEQRKRVDDRSTAGFGPARTTSPGG